MRVTGIMASAAVLAAVVALPQAGWADISANVGVSGAGVSASIGGGDGVDAGARVGGVNAGASVGGTGASAGGGIGGARASAGTAAEVRARLIARIEARLDLLGPRQLMKLCASVGASGCGSASPARQRKLIDARLSALSPNQLASACVSVGGGCGSGSASGGGNAGGGSTGGALAASGAGVNAAGAGASEAEMKLTCRKVLRSPQRYEAGLVALCRQME